ncbi:hypothetical protein SDC9_42636 [bioreactor metagenome]|uniref:Uncharacterized protein n=1 Tax=bioreactor metagenome TaxID=1076179 RepID=A0A644VYA9_9ZZZZ
MTPAGRGKLRVLVVCITVRKALNPKVLVRVYRSYGRLQQRDFVFGQVEQIIDDAVDLGFSLGDLGAVASDPVFPVGGPLSGGYSIISSAQASSAAR